MVGDEREVSMLASPADLVHAQTTTRSVLNCTRRTQTSSRRSRRENPALTRIAVLLLS
jgi:hypothetical protein